MKSLALSPLIYLANVIHVPSRVITAIKEIIVEFISCDGRPPRIPYNVPIQNIKKAGVKLIVFGSKIKVLKIRFCKTSVRQQIGKMEISNGPFLANQ